MSASYLFIVSMDVEPDKEALFNEVYDAEHVPLLLQVPGVRGVTRYRTEALELIVGGERKAIAAQDEPRYTAIYEIDGPNVLVSNAWAEAVDKGRWASEVRPHTKNRRHVLKRRMA